MEYITIRLQKQVEVEIGIEVGIEIKVGIRIEREEGEHAT